MQNATAVKSLRAHARLVLTGTPVENGVAHRIGQKRRVTSIKLIAEGTVEERVLEMQRKKQSVIKATIGTDDAAFMQALSWKDIQELLA